MKMIFKHVLVVLLGLSILNIALPGHPAFAQDKDAKRAKNPFDRIQKAKEEAKTTPLVNKAEDEHNSIAGALVSGIGKDGLLMMATASLAITAAYEGWSKRSRAQIARGWRDLMVDAGLQTEDALRRRMNPLFQRIRDAEQFRMTALMAEDKNTFDIILRRLPADEAADLLARRPATAGPGPSMANISTVNAAYVREVEAYENLLRFIRDNREEFIRRGVSPQRLDAFLARAAELSIDRISITEQLSIASRDSFRRFITHIELFLQREGFGTHNLSRLGGWTRFWNYIGGLRERTSYALLWSLLDPRISRNLITRGPYRVLSYVLGIRSIRGPLLILSGGAVALYFASQLNSANKEVLHNDDVARTLQQNEDELHEKGPDYYQRPLSALVQTVWQSRRFWEDSTVQSKILNARYGKRFPDEFLKFEKENTSFAEREEKLKELLEKADAKDRQEYDRRKDFVASFQKSFCFTKDQVHHDRFPFNFENNLGHRLKMKTAFMGASIELQNQGQPLQGDQNFNPAFWNHFWRNIFTEAVGNSPALAALPQEAIFGADRSGRGGLVEDFAEVSPYVFQYLLQTQRDERRLLGILAGLRRPAREAMLAGINDLERRQTVALLVPILPLPDPDDE